MSRHPIGRALTATVLALCVTGVAQAADKKPLMTGASASMLSNTCAGCHGTDGVSTGPSIPTIAGLSPDYFVTIMEAYKADEAYSTIMGRIAKGYSEEEIQAMADFYAGKKFVAAKQDFDAGKAKKGAALHDKYCEKCHSEGGTLADDDAGILAGQWAPYLDWQVADVSAGKRDVDKKMKKKLKQLQDKEGAAGVEALLHYYSSQQ
ncbi:MAG: c-type cytochrome [bacterium]